jgi:small redox-active disulfide protein 2
LKGNQSMMKIEVLGPGCVKCRTLDENVRAAVEEMGLDAEVTKIEAIKDLAARGVLMTPALSVDGVTVSSGHLLSVRQVKNLLEERASS